MNKAVIIGGIVVAIIIIVAAYSMSYNENQVEVSEGDITEPQVTESDTDEGKHFSIDLDDGVGIAEPWFEYKMTKVDLFVK